MYDILAGLVRLFGDWVETWLDPWRDRMEIAIMLKVVNCLPLLLKSTRTRSLT